MIRPGKYNEHSRGKNPVDQGNALVIFFRQFGIGHGAVRYMDRVKNCDSDPAGNQHIDIPVGKVILIGQGFFCEMMFIGIGAVAKAHI